ncbi:MAG: tyrosine--tRNA ligase [Candidatus Woesearchaeota archaeon]|nr:MAG: tyrosine--tRNA ligase [Candidatus Woesearchaeota archaeon]
MNIEEKLRLIKRNTEEVITEEDLQYFLENKVPLKHYIGFEISGFIHLGTGLMSMSKVKDLQDAGADCSIFLADWHSWINDKLGGDLENIKQVAGGYFKEGLKASLKCVSGDQNKIKFVLGSDLYHNSDEYWQTVIDISKNINLSRVLRSITIMGRKEGETIDFAKLIYPPMQVADIFIQGVNLAHAGLDQRKAHVIAREVGDRIKIRPLKYKNKIIKPVAIHHHLILGIKKPTIWPVSKDKMQELWSSMKMSKSDPNSAIFIHDFEEDIRNKLDGAFCPAGEIEFNPVLDWCKHLIFSNVDKLKVERLSKFGGDLIYHNYSILERDFKENKLHPQDLKKAVAEQLIKILKPARDHFSKGKVASMKEDLEKIKITK